MVLARTTIYRVVYPKEIEGNEKIMYLCTIEPCASAERLIPVEDADSHARRIHGSPEISVQSNMPWN